MRRRNLPSRRASHSTQNLPHRARLTRIKSSASLATSTAPLFPPQSCTCNLQDHQNLNHRRPQSSHNPPNNVPSHNPNQISHPLRHPQLRKTVSRPKLPHVPTNAQNRRPPPLRRPHPHRRPLSLQKSPPHARRFRCGVETRHCGQP